MSSPFAGINPFVGLRAFEREDSLYFFGRRKQTAELLEQLHHNRFLAVLGRSGSGKSSLIRAGLIPALRGGFLVERRDKWVIAVMKPGGSPRYNLAQALLDITTVASMSVDDLEQAIEHDQEAAITRYIQEHIGGDTNVLLLVDQFEELFQFRGVQDEEQLARLEHGVRQKQARNRSEAADFVDVLLSLPEQHELPLYVALTMRSDFLGDCDVFHGLPEAMNRSRYLVPRLDRQQLREAVQGPALLSGAVIAPRLLDRVINDVVGQADQLPVLQHALLRTWNIWYHCGEKAMDLHHYEAVGGLSGALSLHAEEALDDKSKQLTRTIFQSLTDTDSDKRRVRRPVTLSELMIVTGASKSDIEAVIERFQGDGRSFLIASKGRNNETRIDISHESLIRQWKRLRNWIDEEGQSRDEFLNLVSRAREERALLRDPDLQISRQWRKTNNPTQAWAKRYSERDTDFEKAMTYLDESVRAVRSEARKKRWIGIGLGTAAAAAFVTMAALFTRALDAEDEAKLATLEAIEARNLAELLEDAARDAQARAESAESEANSLRDQAQEYATVTDSRLQTLESLVAEDYVLPDGTVWDNSGNGIEPLSTEFQIANDVVAAAIDIPDVPLPSVWEWSNRRIVTSDVMLNGQDNIIRVAPEEQFTISFSWQGTTDVVDGEEYYCPGCIVQLYYGIGGAEINNAQCFISSTMQPYWSREDIVRGSLTAPQAAGVYYITQALTLEYNCAPGKAKLPVEKSGAIATVIVDAELAGAPEQKLIPRSR